MELTLKYFPANSWTPMMAKMSQKMRQTSRTLNMLGMAWTRAFTTTWRSRLPPTSLVIIETPVLISSGCGVKTSLVKYLYLLIKEAKIVRRGRGF